MKRIWTRGIRNANKFMIGAAIAYNLKKYMNYKEKKVKVVAMEMMENKNQNVMNFFWTLLTMEFSEKLFFEDY